MPTIDQEPTLYAWNNVEGDQPMPAMDRKRIFGSEMLVANIQLHVGFHVPTHRHECEQIACVMSGRVRFLIGEPDSPSRREIVVHGGEVLAIPAYVPHEVDALEESVVFDLFSSRQEKMGVDAG